MTIYIQNIYLFFLLTPSIVFGLSFGTLSSISPSGQNGVPPLLAVSNNGNAFAAWINYPLYTLQIAYYNAAPGGGWQSGNLVQGAIDPQIGIDSAGNAFVVWVTQSSNRGSSQIFVSRFTPSSPLVPVLTTQLSTPGTYNSSPQLAVSPSGSAVVIWFQTQPYQFLSKSFNLTTNTWSSPVTLPFNTSPASLSLDNFGNGFAIFNISPQNTIQVSRITAP